MLQFHSWPHGGSSIQTNQKLPLLGLGCNHESRKTWSSPQFSGADEDWEAMGPTQAAADPTIAAAPALQGH